MYNLNSSGSYLNISKNEKCDKFFRLQELDRICGLLDHFEIIPEGLLAIIADVSVLLPLELEKKLEGMVGHEIAIAKISGFHFRVL
jgi:hypothetical protein